MSIITHSQAILRAFVSAWDRFRVFQDPLHSAVTTTISVNGTPLPLRVGVSNLTGRRAILIEAAEAGLKFGFSSNAADCVYDLPNADHHHFDFGPEITVYGYKPGGGSSNVQVTEFA